MQFVQNFPFFSILLTLMGAVASSVMSGKRARRTTLFLIAADLAFTVGVMIYTLRTGDSYAYKMGHFPAPWGNEIRVGVLETVSLTVFLLVILFSFLGGMRRSEKEIEPTKYNIYCILTDLTMLSLIALVYTNDLFTAYVFIEINTLAAAGLVMMRQHGRALVAGVRYMMMNLLGSSLFLIGIVILYTITGHLLMVNIHESVVALAASGQYHVPLTVVVSLISVGLAMKCALFPFDKWLPAAYSNSTPSGSAMLSSIVSKGYIFLLIKVYVRVIGFDVIRSLGICDVLFVFGAIGMIAGSVNAMRAKTGDAVDRAAACFDAAVKDFALADRQHACDHIDRRRLAGAVRADQRMDAVFRHFKRQVVHGDQAGKAFCDMLHFQDRLHHARLPLFCFFGIQNRPRFFSPPNRDTSPLGRKIANKSAMMLKYSQ